MPARKILNWIIILTVTAPIAVFNSCDDEDLKAILPDPVIDFNPSLTYGSVTDIDGNTYKTIQVGEALWMAENIRVTKYSNGDVIPNVKDSVAWLTLTSGGYCDYKNQSKISEIYGRLYNGYVISDARSICPTGWRVATAQDWQNLYIGDAPPYGM
jgi:hypothetical protein